MRKFLLVAASGLAALLLVEGVCRLFVDFRARRAERAAVLVELALPVIAPAPSPGPEAIGATTAQAASGSALEDLLADPAHSARKPHPYLGFVYDERSNRIPGRWERGFPTLRDDGFFVTRSMLGAGPDAFHVGVFGGSLAMLMALQGEEEFLAGLASLPGVGSRPVVVECLALGGFKQPQQLAALAYFAAMGRRWDLVINLDGFNEVALTWAENVPAGVPLDYPRAWEVIAQGLTDSAQLRRAVSVTQREDRRGRVAEIFSRPQLRWSAAANWIWGRWDPALAADLAQARLALAESRAAAVPATPRDEAKVIRDSVALWASSSRAMDGLTRSLGGRYLHFLQPNLFDPGMGKPLTSAERALLNVGSPLHRPAALGYPALAAAGQELSRSGVLFFDLRGVFDGLPAVQWIDACCHVDRRGSEELAKEIGRLARLYWK